MRACYLLAGADGQAKATRLFVRSWLSGGRPNSSPGSHEVRCFAVVGYAHKKACVSLTSGRKKWAEPCGQDDTAPRSYTKSCGPVFPIGYRQRTAGEAIDTSDSTNPTPIHFNRSEHVEETILLFGIATVVLMAWAEWMCV